MQLGTQVPHPPAPLEQPEAVRLWDGGLPLDPARTRAQIGALEAALAQHPDAVFGDSDLCPLTHRFADGIYVREIFIPKDMVVTGKIHKQAHPVFLMQGELIVVTEAGGRQHLKAPLCFIAPPWTKRAAVTLADTVWITVHATSATDLATIEAEVIATEYEAVPVAHAATTPRAGEESTPCRS
jgi:hypothetical protein